MPLLSFARSVLSAALHPVETASSTFGRLSSAVQGAGVREQAKAAVNDVMELMTALSLRSLRVAALAPLLVDVVRTPQAEQLCRDCIALLKATQRLLCSQPVQSLVKQSLRVVRSDACTELIAALGSAALSLLRVCQSERAALANTQLADAISSQLSSAPAAASSSSAPSPSPLSSSSSASYQNWLNLVAYLHHLHRGLHLLTTEELATAVAMLTDREAELMRLWSGWQDEVTAAMQREGEGERKQEEEEEKEEEQGVLRECRLYQLAGEHEQEKEADISHPNAEPLDAVHARFIEQLRLLRARREGEPDV